MKTSAAEANAVTEKLREDDCEEVIRTLSEGSFCI